MLSSTLFVTGAAVESFNSSLVVLFIFFTLATSSNMSSGFLRSFKSFMSTIWYLTALSAAPVLEYLSGRGSFKIRHRSVVLPASIRPVRTTTIFFCLNLPSFCSIS